MISYIGMIDWSNLAVVCALLVCLVLLFSVLSLTRNLERCQRELAQLKNEYRAVGSGTIGMGKKMMKIEAALARLEKSKVQPQSARASTPPPQPSMKEHSQLAGFFAKSSQNKLANSSESLSEGEAELFKLMQAAKKHHDAQLSKKQRYSAYS